jgi:hypothetical protein
METQQVTVRSLSVLRGPNLYAYMPVLHAVMDIAARFWKKRAKEQRQIRREELHAKAQSKGAILSWRLCVKDLLGD